MAKNNKMRPSEDKDLVGPSESEEGKTRKTKFIAILVYASVVIVSCVYRASLKQTHSYLWRITPPNNGGVPSYVLGTLHMPPKKILPYLPGNIMEAFKLSDTYVAEVDLAMFRAWKNINTEEKHKYWMEKQLDYYLMSTAAANNKSVMGLQTKRQTLEYLSMQREVNEDINKAINDDPLARIVMTEEIFIELYLNGELPRSREEMFNSFFYILHKVASLRNEWPSEILRNKRMAAEMGRIMMENSEKTFFFAVGVDHLNYITPKNPNILQHLEVAGFRIERIPPGERITGKPENDRNPNFDYRPNTEYAEYARKERFHCEFGQTETLHYGEKLGPRVGSKNPIKDLVLVYLTWLGKMLMLMWMWANH